MGDKLAALRRMLLPTSSPTPPLWDDGVYGYLVNYVSANVWKLRGVMDVDDVLQEAYFLYLRVVRNYPDATGRRLMGIWKLAVARWFNQKLCCGQVNRSRTTVALDDRVVPDYRQSLEWEHRVADAPPAVRKLVEEAMARTRRLKWQKRGKSRKTTNQYLCRIAGEDPATTPLRQQFESWLDQ